MQVFISVLTPERVVTFLSKSKLLINLYFKVWAGEVSSNENFVFIYDIMYSKHC